jgi:hypothetical protein
VLAHRAHAQDAKHAVAADEWEAAHRLSSFARARSVRLEFLPGHVQQLTRREHASHAIGEVVRRDPFAEDALTPGEVERDQPQFAGLGIGQRHGGALAVHDVPDARRHLAQERPEIKVRNDPVREIEEQAKPLFCALGLAEVPRSVHGERDLRRRERQKPDILGSVRADEPAREHDAAQSPVGRAQRERADRSQAYELQPLHAGAKPRFILDVRDDK